MFTEYSSYEEANVKKLREFKRRQDEKIAELERKTDNVDYRITAFEEVMKKKL